MLARDEVILLDLYAGVEHLGRSTADSVDVMLVVAEPTLRSLQIVAQITKMAADIGITNLLLVGNKVNSDADLRFIEDSLPNMPICGFLGNSKLAVNADRSGESLYGLDGNLASSIAVIAAAAEETCRDQLPAAMN